MHFFQTKTYSFAWFSPQSQGFLLVEIHKPTATQVWTFVSRCEQRGEYDHNWMKLCNANSQWIHWCTLSFLEGKMQMLFLKITDHIGIKHPPCVTVNILIRKCARLISACITEQTTAKTLQHQAWFCSFNKLSFQHLHTIHPKNFRTSKYLRVKAVIFYPYVYLFYVLYQLTPTPLKWAWQKIQNAQNEKGCSCQHAFHFVFL